MPRANEVLVQEIEGERSSIFFDRDMVREAFEIKPRPGDIVLMAYPSSGTHWMMQMIQLIIHEGRSAHSYEEFYSRFCFLELCGRKADEVTYTPRLLVTHIRPEKVAVTSEAKYVYIARTPWDVCTSLYQGWRAMPGAPTFSSFGEYLSSFLLGNVCTGSHFQHLHEGYARRNERNFFFMTYEEAKLDFKGVFLRLAEFLSPSYARALRDDPELLGDVTRQCEPDFMRRILEMPWKRMIELAHRSPNLEFESTEAPEETKETSFNFVRQATSGRWAQAFNKVQLRQLLKTIDEMPEAQCVKNIWKDEFLKVAEAAL